MPSKNPRLSVVITPSLMATLTGISEETGESASSIVRGFLEQAEPALVRMLQLVKAAKDAKGTIGAGVGQALDRVVVDLEEALDLADIRTERALGDLVASAEAVPSRRRWSAAAAQAERAAAAGVPTPVPVTRGSGGTSQGVKRPQKGMRRGSV
jgi:hypothetical protein